MDRCAVLRLRPRQPKVVTGIADRPGGDLGRGALRAGEEFEVMCDWLGPELGPATEPGCGRAGGENGFSDCRVARDVRGKDGSCVLGHVRTRQALKLHVCRVPGRAWVCG